MNIDKLKSKGQDSCQRMPKTILVTGGTGFIGRQLLRLLTSGANGLSETLCYAVVSPGHGRDLPANLCQWDMSKSIRPEHYLRKLMRLYTLQQSDNGAMLRSAHFLDKSVSMSMPPHVYLNGHAVSVQSASSIFPRHRFSKPPP